MPGAGCACAYFEKFRSSDSSSVLMLACPARRSRLFDRWCVVAARPRNAYGERKRCSSGFHDPANSISFSSLQLLGRSTLLLAIGTADATADAGDKTLRKDADQRRDRGIQSPGDNDRLAGHHGVVALARDVRGRHPHEA